MSYGPCFSRRLAGDGDPGRVRTWLASAVCTLLVATLWPGVAVEAQAVADSSAVPLPPAGVPPPAIDPAGPTPVLPVAPLGQPGLVVPPAATCPESGQSWSEPIPGGPGSLSPPPYLPSGPAGLRHRWLPFAPGFRLRGWGEALEAKLQPLAGESWRHRPLSAGWYMGAISGSAIRDDWLGQGEGFFGGYRFGWDFDHYWGCEMRFGFASIELTDSQRAKQAQADADALLNLSPSDPFLTRFDHRRDADLRLWDVDLVYYPWGETAWRPYLLFGLGTARIDFTDRLSVREIDTVLGMPLAVGLKYRLRDWLALRCEAADNIVFGSGGDFNTLHNVSFTAGLEVRFGGSRTAYWPYNPGRHYW